MVFSIGKKKKKKQQVAAFEQQDVNSCVEHLPFKRLMQTSQGALKLKEYGYMQLLEITGKDLFSMGEAEVRRTLQNFENWLTKYTGDFDFYTTTLPTKTDEQIEYLKEHLGKCREKMKHVRTERVYQQLIDREAVLLEKIQIEEQIREQICNTEYILLLYANSPKELDENVRKAKAYGNGDFVPKELTPEKKEQVLEQYNNLHDKR